MAAARPLVRTSNGAFWRPLSLPRRWETWRGLEHLFAEDVVSYSDGGGLVRAAGVPVSGRKRVATFIAAVSTWCWKGVTIDWVETNGQASVLILRDGVPIGLTMDASHQGIHEIMWFLRPSKLAAISRPGQRLSDGYAPGPAAASLTADCNCGRYYHSEIRPQRQLSHRQPCSSWLRASVPRLFVPRASSQRVTRITDSA
jgi:hypothetical protein